MMSKISLLVLSFFLAQSSWAQNRDQADSLLISEVIKAVQGNHLDPLEVNDDLSAKIFDDFVLRMDVEKLLFTSREIVRLKQYRLLVDDDLLSGQKQFFNSAVEMVREGIDRAKMIALLWFSQDVEAISDEPPHPNLLKRRYARDEEALEKRWDAIMRNKFLSYLKAIDQVEVEMDLEQRRKLAFQRTVQFYQSKYDALAERTEEEWFHELVNSYLRANDYQSHFYSHVQKKKWDAEFNRVFVGVGVGFAKENGYYRVTQVMVNSPAWKVGMIEKGDLLLGIMSPEGKLIEFAGKSSSQVSGLIKGDAGTTAKLKVRRGGGEAYYVEIPRGKVPLSRSMAFVLSGGPDDEKVGYIKLDRFYQGEEGCASDVLKNLDDLKAAGVQGLILDLRNNIGGSAIQARRIMGYFLKGDTIMQSRYADGSQRVFVDEDPAAQYSGKLLVLVNDKSASASELLSGTMQDRGRAIVVGRQTFGKGTIQRFLEVVDPLSAEPLGNIKLTIGNFYTGGGYSTQYNGITPDINLGNPNSSRKTGERKLENALRFEHLGPQVLNVETPFLDSLAKLRHSRKLKTTLSKLSAQIVPEGESEDKLADHLESTVLKDNEIYEGYLIMSDMIRLSRQDQAAN